MRRTFATATLAAGLLTAALTTPTAAGSTPTWHLRFTDDFNTTVAKGRFTDCNHSVDTPKAYCGGLTGSTRTNWWAYPAGWPDTATQRHYPVGGYYDPATTLSISGGQLHIRMWRGTTGSIHSATIVPKALMGQRYGRYEERWRVSKTATGYKSAHLLWPVSNTDQCSEIDFPELEWTKTIAAFAHPSNCGKQMGIDTGKHWTDWHTSVIEWKPGRVSFILDGRTVGTSTDHVPSTAANWDIQNEAALNGDRATPNSSAQMDIAYVKGWTWR
ncbi:glycoside hydrolase family 16 protein [Streptomyces kaempferi]|uniref:Glycoside hydrolase family 16 protein n=1 Tax=Streptomyces kaempferi TaxID=333725 RepID=A0ABW3XIU5_9ACTN